MIECGQCDYTFEITDERVLTRHHKGADLEGRDILICCPRCDGLMFFEYCKTISQDETEEK